MKVISPLGFKEAEEIFEDIYTSRRSSMDILSPTRALAYWEPSGKLVIYSSTQNPSLVRAQLADLFNLPQSKVRLIVPYVGGGYGAKTHPRLTIDGDMARKAYRPVQWVFSREEVFLYRSLSGSDRADQNRREKTADRRPSS